MYDFDVFEMFSSTFRSLGRVGEDEEICVMYTPEPGLNKEVLFTNKVSAVWFFCGMRCVGFDDVAIFATKEQRSFA